MYEEIMNLPRHRSTANPPMPQKNRAAQFAPFAALTGFESIVQEAARLTEPFIVLDDAQKEQLDRTLQYIRSRLAQRPVVTLTYFQKDPRKSGGVYLTHTNPVVKIDDCRRCICFADGTKVCVDDVSQIDADTPGRADK